MKNKIIKISINKNQSITEKLILKTLEEKKIIYIVGANDSSDEISKTINYQGPAIILKSSGTRNQPKKCIHNLNNLDQSANSSGFWLEEQGLKLKNCFIINTLPLNHISGFMGLWRSKVWDCSYINIPPKLLKNSEHLFQRTLIQKNISSKHLITSLVPTQLYRLINNEFGLNWLKLFDIIWVGGAPLSKGIINKCVLEKINISLCYGSTETAAMISSLKPSEFLKGNMSTGEILQDINIRINKSSLIEIATKRIGMEFINYQEIKSFKNKYGWWESGDLGELIKINDILYLKVNGRSDNAFFSGGETIFPDLIKKRLFNYIEKEKIPIDNLIISKINDEIWGNKYEVIIYFKKNTSRRFQKEVTKSLNDFTEKWLKHEKPKRWVINQTNNFSFQKNKKNWKLNY